MRTFLTCLNIDLQFRLGFFFRRIVFQNIVILENKIKYNEVHLLHYGCTCITIHDKKKLLWLLIDAVFIIQNLNFF